MPQYRFRAVNNYGHILTGRMTAANENHLAERLADIGYELIVMRARQRVRWQRLWQTEDDLKQHVLLFTQLASLSAAGVPLVACLEDAVAAMPDSRLRDAVRETMQDARDGTDFADACAKHPYAFPPAIVALICAGMASGDLVSAFAQARDHAVWRAELGMAMRRALRYPLFLLAMSLAASGFLLIAVVPQLAAFLQEQNIELPWHTQLLVAAAGQFLNILWAAPLLLAVGAGLVIWGRRQSKSFVLTTDRFVLSVPFCGKIIGAIERARYLHHLATLTGGGVPLLEALTIARQALVNRALAAEADAIRQAVANGTDLASAMQSQPGFAGVPARRAQIGLQSGSLAEQLAATSKELDEDAAERCKRLTGALEPALILVVGLLLLWIVLAVLGPLYGSLEKLG